MIWRKGTVPASGTVFLQQGGTMHIHPPATLPVVLSHPTERAEATKRAAETRKKLTSQAASILGEQESDIWTVERSSQSSPQPGSSAGGNEDPDPSHGLSITV